MQQYFYAPHRRVPSLVTGKLAKANAKDNSQKKVTQQGFFHDDRVSSVMEQRSSSWPAYKIPEFHDLRTPLISLPLVGHHIREENENNQHLQSVMRFTAHDWNTEYFVSAL